MAGAVLSGDPAAPVEAIPAASVMLLRGEPFEVLMLRRHARSSFVPSAWVFPGGIVERADEEASQALADGSQLATMRIAAVRETFEESGVWIGDALPEMQERRRALLARELAFSALTKASAPALERLILTSRWITPVGLPKRFDTWFFLAEVPAETAASPEQQETVETLWIRSQAALESHARGEMQMVFPTLRNLEAIAAFQTAEELIASRRDAVIEPILPILVDGRPTLKQGPR